MGVQTEEAVLKIKVDNAAANASVTELNQQIKYLTTSLYDMHKADNPSLYQSRIDQLKVVTDTRNKEKKAIDDATKAIKDNSAADNAALYQAKVAELKNLINARDAEAKSIKAAAAEAAAYSKKIQDGLNQVKALNGQNPIGSIFNSLKGQISGDDSLSKFISTIQSGYGSITTAGTALRDKLANINKEFKTQKEALDAVKEAQVAVNDAMAVNQSYQEALVIAQSAATSAEERNIIALAQQKAAEEEAALATTAQTIAMNAQAVATDTGSVALRVFKFALASTGIGLLIVAISSLIAYFGETNEGSKKLKVVMAELDAVFQSLLKSIAPIGKAIVDTFTNSEGPVRLLAGLLGQCVLPLATIITLVGDIAHGEFKKAFQDGAAAVKQFGVNLKNTIQGAGETIVDLSKNIGGTAKNINITTESLKEAAKQAREVTVERQKLVVTEREWSTEKLKQEGQVALLVKQLRDQNLTEKQRINLAEQAKTVRQKTYETDLAIAKKNEELVNREQALNSKKDLQAITDAKNRVQQVTNAYLNQSQVIENKQSALEKKDAKGSASKESKHNSFVDGSNSLSDQFKEFNAAELADTVAKNDKEIQSTENKYDKMIAAENAWLEKAKKNKNADSVEIKKHEDEVAQLQVNKVDQVNKIRERQEQDITDKIIALKDTLNAKIKSELDKENVQINQAYDQMSKDAGTNSDLQAKIEAGRQSALADAKIREEKRFQDEKQKITADGAITDAEKDQVELAKINKKYDDEILALKNKFSAEFQATKEFQEAIDKINGQRKQATDKYDDDQQKKKTEKNVDFATKEAQTVSNAYFTISNRSRQTDTDNKIKSLEDQKDAELSNVNLTTAQKQAITEKYAKQEADIKRQAWEADQTAAVEQAIINGALAVGKALAQVGPLGAFVIPGIIAETAAQVAIIESQKAPQFAMGGLIPDGPSHADGGINLVNNQTGEPIAEIEGGEPIMILSKDTYANNKMLVNELLYNSQYRNGAPVSVNSALAIKAMQQFRTGGMIQQPGAVNQAPAAINPGSAVDMSQTNQLLSELTDHFKTFSQKPWDFNYRAFEIFKNQVDSFRNNANAK